MGRVATRDVASNGVTPGGAASGDVAAGGIAGAGGVAAAGGVATGGNTVGGIATRGITTAGSATVAAAGDARKRRAAVRGRLSVCARAAAEPRGSQGEGGRPPRNLSQERSPPCERPVRDAGVTNNTVTSRPQRNWEGVPSSASWPYLAQKSH